MPTAWLAWRLMPLLMLSSTTITSHASAVGALTRQPLDPADVFPSQPHPLTPAIDTSELSPESLPLHSHKFYTNLLLEDGQALPIYPNPYILQFATTTTKLQPYSGVSISCNKERVRGGKGLVESAVGFEMNAVSTNLGFSSVEHGEHHTAPHRSLMAADAFGATVRLYADSKHRDSQYVEFPMTYGMAYVTAVYDTLTPLLFSVAAVVKINDKPVDADTLYTADDDTHRLSVELNNGQLWHIYIASDNSHAVKFKHALTSTGSQLVASRPFTGSIRVAKLPKEYEQNDVEAMTSALDKHYNVVPIGGQLQELTVNSKTVEYAIEWQTTNLDTASSTNELLHYALAHHIQSLDTSDKCRTVDAMQIQSTATGMMTAVVGRKWQFTEAAPPSIIYDSPTLYPLTDSMLKQYDNEVLQTLIDATIDDIEAFDLDQTLKIESNYYIGKFAVKLGQLCGVASTLIDVQRDEAVGHALKDARRTCVDQLETLMTAFVDGKWPNSVVYDSSRYWHLIVGHLGLKDQTDYTRGIDFFGSYGNDQHYHYGYVLHAVNILAELKPEWLTQKVVDQMTTIIRSTVNPSRLSDSYFPQMRIFDLYSGHAWSSSLVASADGHDEESTSEAVNFYYSVLKFGQLSEQPAVMDIGTLLLAITQHTIPLYQLYTADNTVMPPEITANKVSGIIFENKVAPEATWFDPSVAAIHGIQMLPFMVTTPLIRKSKFVHEEWKAILPSIQATLDDPTIAWNSILWVNYCQIDSKVGIKHLMDDDLMYDNGLSSAYALYWCMTVDALSNDISAAHADKALALKAVDEHALLDAKRTTKRQHTQYTFLRSTPTIAASIATATLSALVLRLLWYSTVKGWLGYMHKAEHLHGSVNERKPLLAG